MPRCTHSLMVGISFAYGWDFMLDLHKLRIFIQVSQANSFSAAADALLMTQSGVSQHIQELENTLGTRLFERKPRGVALTPPGQTLLTYAEQILGLVSEAENAVADVAKLTGGVIRLGATPGVGMYVLPAWIANFRVKQPHTQIELATRTTAEIMNSLRANQLDIGVIEGEVDEEHAGFSVRLLQDVEQYLIVGPTHGWFQRSSVRVNELNGEMLISRQRGSASRVWLDEIFKRHNVRVRIVAEFDNVESIKRAVGGSNALSVLPRYTIEQEEKLGLLKALHIDGAPMQRTIRAVWNANTPLFPAANAFLNQVAAEFNRTTF